MTIRSGKGGRLLLIVWWTLLLSCPTGKDGVLATDHQVIFEKQSLYQYLMVSENGSFRFLHSGKLKNRETAVDLKRPDRLVFDYTRVMVTALGLIPREPSSVLFIGMGGGSLSMYIRHYYPELEITVVEIDPVVVALAKAFFYFHENPHTWVVIKDGRRFVSSDKQQYDIIFIDAYIGDRIPFHLTTQEFFSVLKQRLSSKGVIAVNIKGGSRLSAAQVKTMSHVFDQMVILERLGGMIVFGGNCMMTKLDIKKRLRAVQAKRQFKGLNIERLWMIRGLKREFWNDNTPVLTDNYAPVEYLSRQSLQ